VPVSVSVSVTDSCPSPWPPLPLPLRALTDQAVRAVTSVPLNLAEGAGRRGRDRLHHWRIAYGSALEARTALELLVATGCVDVDAAATAEALLDRVAAMAWRLVRPAREPCPFPSPTVATTRPLVPPRNT
jgi:four helix bundle protein